MVEKYNLEYINEMADGDKVFAREMLELFVEDVPVTLGTLKNAIVDEDAEGIRTSAHKIKTQLRYVGLSQTQEQAFVLEQNSGKLGKDQIQAIFDSISEVVHHNTTLITEALA